MSLSLFSLLVIAVSSSPCLAEGDAQHEKQGTSVSSQSPRYRLEDSPAIGRKLQRESIDAPSTADFSWKSLTARGAASGEVPEIGPKSSRPAYDFKDGLSQPLRAGQIR